MRFMGSGNRVEQALAFVGGGMAGGFAPPASGEFGFPSLGISARLVHAVADLRRQREEVLPGNLVADPAWDLLLQLFAAHLDQHRVSTSSLSKKAGVPLTTTVRVLRSLEDAGLVDRRGDPTDSRRVFVSLSKSGVERMHRYFVTAGARTAFV